jgi:hypothetical protein
VAAAAVLPAVLLAELPQLLLLLGREHGAGLLRRLLPLLAQLLHEGTRLLAALLHLLPLRLRQLRPVATAPAAPCAVGPGGTVAPARALGPVAAAGTVPALAPCAVGTRRALGEEGRQLLAKGRGAGLQLAVDGLETRHLVRRKLQALALAQDALHGAAAAGAAMAVKRAAAFAGVLAGCRGRGLRRGRNRSGHQGRRDEKARVELHRSLLQEGVPPSADSRPRGPYMKKTSGAAEMLTRWPTIG